MQIEAGACGIAVAKLGEAEVMAAHGFDDILIANEIIGDMKIAGLIRLSAEGLKISCCVDSILGANRLSETFIQFGLQLNVYIEVDSGLERCGLNNSDDIIFLAKQVSQMHGLRLRGLLTHAGQAYKAMTFGDIEQIGCRDSSKIVEI
ncbi:MAG: hypothetical protein QG635_2091 [Bacteroidota bacterium]|nr:hypothetical protein [Bacteroidota bacterium]